MRYYVRYAPLSCFLIDLRLCSALLDFLATVRSSKLLGRAVTLAAGFATLAKDLPKSHAILNAVYLLQKHVAILHHKFVLIKEFFQEIF